MRCCTVNGVLTLNILQIENILQLIHLNKEIICCSYLQKTIKLCYYIHGFQYSGPNANSLQLEKYDFIAQLMVEYLCLYVIINGYTVWYQPR